MGGIDSIGSGAPSICATPLAHVLVDVMNLFLDSKWLSFILRHRPDEAGLELDVGGWVSIEDLLIGARARGRRRLTREKIEAIAAENNKRRFEISEDGLRIRARHGHT